MKILVSLLLLCIWPSLASAQTTEFEQDTVYVSETQRRVTVFVRASSGFDTFVTVEYRTENNSAEADYDYAYTEGTMNFGNRGGRQSFDVDIYDDDFFEGDEIVDLVLRSNGQEIDRAQLVIRDNESDVSFSSGSYFVTESQGTASITLRRRGTAVSGSVDYVVSPGTATAGSDYTPVSGTATFPVGADTSTFNVPILVDGIREPNETINLTLTNPVSVALGSIPQAILTIVGASPGLLDITFNPEPGSGASPVACILSHSSGHLYVGGRFESFGGMPRTNVVRLHRNGTLDTSFVMTNKWTHSNEFVIGMTERSDGSLNIAGSFTLSATGGGSAVNTALLQTNGSIGGLGSFPNRFVGFAGLSDGGFVGSEEMFNQADRATRVSATGARLSSFPGIPSADTVTVADGRSNRFLYASGGIIRRVQANGTLDSGFNPTVDGAVSSMLLQPDGKILVAGDFTAINGVAAPGLGRLNSNGSFDSTFVPGSGPDIRYVSAMAYSSGKVIIAGLFTSYDGIPRAGIARLHNDGSLDMSFDPGTGFPTSGASPMGIFTLLTADPDSLYAGGTFSSYSGVPRHGIVRIHNGPSAGLDTSRRRVSETNGTIRLFIENPSGRPFTADCLTIASNAVSAADFVNFTGTVIFADGETNKSIDLTVVNDEVGESTESFFFLLTNVVGTVEVANRKAEIIIVDDDSTLNFSTNLFAVSENGGTAVVSVVRTGISNRTSSVTYITSDGTASAGEDYSAQVGTLNFGVGETTKTFSIPIQWDAQVEGDETIQLVLTSPSGASLGQQNMATVSITDYVHFLRFSSGRYTVGEGNSNVTVQVDRVGVNSNSTTVVYSTGNGSAVAGSDYQSSANQLTFAPGETTKTILVPIVADTTVETNEDFRITLSAPGAQALLGSPSNTVITIVDDDASFRFQSDITFDSSSVTLRLETAAGNSYVVDGSTNLIDWAPLATNAGQNSVWQFSDTNTALFKKRFYRARKVLP